MLVRPDELLVPPSPDDCRAQQELPVLHLLIASIETAASAISSAWTLDEQCVLRGFPPYDDETAVREEVIQAGRALADAVGRYHGATYWRRVPPDDLVDEDASDAEDRLLF